MVHHDLDYRPCRFIDLGSLDLMTCLITFHAIPFLTS